MGVCLWGGMHLLENLQYFYLTTKQLLNFQQEKLIPDNSSKMIIKYRSITVFETWQIMCPSYTKKWAVANAISSKPFPVFIKVLTMKELAHASNTLDFLMECQSFQAAYLF